MRPTIVLAAALAVLSVPALAGQQVSLAPFQTVDMHGGVDVVLKHGDVQRVTLLKGTTQYTTLKVTNGKLEITGCDFWRCPWGYESRVEIVTPKVVALDVHGGGDLIAQGSFPQQDKLSLNVHGGGDADVRAIPVRNVSAEVHGGGDLRVTAQQSLSGSVGGGGDVTYWGHPKEVNVATHGGGDISSGD